MTKLLILLFALVLLPACSTRAPVPVSSLVDPGSQLETLSSSVTISLRTAEKNLAGRGFMVYRRPDQMRLILLSPFGTTLMEARLDGENLTLSYPAKAEAFSGRISELPPATGQRGLSMLRWVLASDSPKNAAPNGLIEQQNDRGVLERITMQDGVVTEKSLATGERVRYRNFKVLSGVLVPHELQMESAEGDRIRLTLEEPEVNVPLEQKVFSVHLDGFRIFPLSALKPH